MEARLKGIAYFFGAAAYFCEIVLLTDCFTAKVPHKELFMAYCFGPMYILLGLSYLLGSRKSLRLPAAACLYKGFII